MEAGAGIEPANRGFAVQGITTLLPGLDSIDHLALHYYGDSIKYFLKAISYLTLAFY